MNKIGYQESRPRLLRRPGHVHNHPLLKENYNNCEVIAVSGNVGQADELEGLEEKALKTGASKLYVEDLTDEFVDDFVVPAMKAGAKYEEYLLGTSLARPVIAKRLAEIAIAEGADAICHGCTARATTRSGLSSRSSTSSPTCR